MHFFPMAMYTHKLVPPPKEVSTELGEVRSAKRGAVSIDILDETDGLGGLKDKYVHQLILCFPILSLVRPPLVPNHLG